MDAHKFDKLHRQNRIILIVLALVLLVNGFIVLLYLGTKNNNNQIPQPIVSQGIAGLKGEKGDKGDQGEIGLMGYQGQQGPSGIQGSIGPQGIPGLQGPQGIQGEPGVDGQEGAPGEPGPPGIAGDPGPPGRRLELRCNTETGMFEQRYEGDTDWVPIEGSECRGQPDVPTQ